MTNEVLQTNDTNTSATLIPRLLVAIEMSLKNWRLVMSPEGGTRNRVKTVEAGNYLELEKAVVESRERFKLPPQTPLVFCYEAGRDGFYPYRRFTKAGHEHRPRRRRGADVPRLSGFFRGLVQGQLRHGGLGGGWRFFGWFP